MTAVPTGVTERSRRTTSTPPIRQRSIPANCPRVGRSWPKRAASRGVHTGLVVGAMTAP